jgi:hypothetical protein
MPKVILLLFLTFCCQISGAAQKSTTAPVKPLPLRKPAAVSSRVPPKPTKPRLKKGQYISVRGGGNVLITPRKLQPYRSADPAYFEITQVGSTAVLNFRGKDPTIQLNPQASLVIQLVPSAPLQVQPTVILNSDWAKARGNQMVIKVSGALPKHENRILGKASFTYCQSTTHVCKKILTPINFFYK